MSDIFVITKLFEINYSIEVFIAKYFGKTYIRVLLISKCEWYVENLVTDMYNDAYVQCRA